MGLDWIPGCKPLDGCEDEFIRLFKEIRWRGSILGRISGQVSSLFLPKREPTDSLVERLRCLSVDPYETLDAPVVGLSKEADDWAREIYQVRKRQESEEQFVTKLHGIPVLCLLPECDGIPLYSNGEPGGYVDEFSFRGQFLLDCHSVVGRSLIESAYSAKLPKELSEYGRALRSALERYAGANGIALERLPLDKECEGVDLGGGVYLVEELQSPTDLAEIVLSASKWCLFWGEKGHCMEVYY